MDPIHNNLLKPRNMTHNFGPQFSTKKYGVNEISFAYKDVYQKAIIDMINITNKVGRITTILQFNLHRVFDAIGVDNIGHKSLAWYK